MKKIKMLIINILMIGIISITNYSIADVGDFESYDSDWGGGSDWSSSSDWGSSSDWSSSSYDGSGSYSSGGSGIVLYILIILVIVIATNASYKKSINKTATISPRNQYHKSTGYVISQTRSDAVANKIREIDKQFNEEKFLAWTKNLFVKLQTAWAERDWETIRPLETEDLFEQHSKQLKGYKERKQINKIERICVNFAELVSFSQDNEKDILMVALNSSMIDYIIDETSGKVLKGSKDNRLTNTYKLTFIRKKGVLTEAGTDELKTTNCPNCGAPTTITSAGKCEYCGSVITTGEHGWVLGDLERFV